MESEQDGYPSLAAIEGSMLVRPCMPVCLFAVTCAADEFYLKDRNGMESGPFRTRVGTTVNTADQDFEVSRVDHADEAVMETMRRIIIPSIAFHDTSITNAIEFLMKVGKENDPDKKGVNITLWPPATVPLFKDPAQGIANVTLAASNITLATAVRILAHSAGLEDCIDAGGIRLILPNEPKGPILRRVFSLAQPIRERSADVAEGIKDFCASLGVGWPRGSFIAYGSSFSTLHVANTEENLDRLAEVLSELRAVPMQVEISMLFIRFDTTNLVHLAPDGLNARALMRAWTNGCGRLLAAPSVVARSGAEASVRGVKGVIYPTSWVVPDGTPTGATNALASCYDCGMAGTDFATRELGSILTVMPEISLDGDTIDLTLTPQYVELPFWKDNGYDLPAADKPHHVPHEQPIFYVYSLTTQVSLSDGATVLIGGGMPTHDGTGMIYSFLTARLIGTDGEPIRRPRRFPVPTLTESR